jgi:prevent-host-death family protein
MAIIVTATEAKAKLLALLDAVEQGEEVSITRHGRTIARLAPARGAHALRARFAGIVQSSAPDEDLFSTGENWAIEADDGPA